MSDHQPGHEPDEPELRREPARPGRGRPHPGLLADARHTEPMPADVAARLDRVLVGLRSPDGAGAGRARSSTWPAAPAHRRQAARRRGRRGRGRRRHRPGAPQRRLRQRQRRRGHGRRRAGRRQAEGGDAGDAGRAAPTSERPRRRPRGARPATPPAHIRAAHFGADVRRVRSQLAEATPRPRGRAGRRPACPHRSARARSWPRRTTAPPPPWCSGPPAGDTQVVDLYLCGQPSRAQHHPDRPLTGAHGWHERHS